MSTTAKYWIIGIIVVIALAAVAWLSLGSKNPFPVDAADHLSDWSIPVNIDASSTALFEAQIVSLKGELGTTTVSAADIDVEIANAYLTLGQGQQAYQYYGKALTASSSESVAYLNLGALFARLHATSTALSAYTKAVAAAPSIELYQLSYLTYLAQVAPTASSTAAAFEQADRALGSETSDYLIVRAEWEGSTGSTSAAIADWEKVRTQVPPVQQAAIDAKIAQLRP
ncbi:MAG: hypothetical protein ACREGR_02010 [Minisyncoccia bacterium]